MIKLIYAILIVLFLSGEYFAQPKLFGYRISGNGDIVSRDFFIQNGTVLDSVRMNNKSFYLKYNEEGKLIIDINFFTYPVIEYVNGRPRIVQKPGYHHYFYNQKGEIDSVGTGMWTGALPVNDSTGYRISYSYDKEGNLLSKNYSSIGNIYYSEANTYDTSGNLILNKIIRFDSDDTTYNIREYDSLNRLTLTKSIRSSYTNQDQRIYEYDSLGNVNCTVQTIRPETIENNLKYYLEFDESGKLTNEILFTAFSPTDSTWSDTLKIFHEYDENGRMTRIVGPVSWFYYDADGNLDSLLNTHVIYSGYVGVMGKLYDSYGNIISFSETYGSLHFFYSNLVTGIEGNKAKVNSFRLSQNYPNPFNPTTNISYTLPKSSFVTLKIYDILGKEIAALVNEEKPGGTYNVTWNAQNVTSGVYFYKITAGEYSKVNKMILIK